MPIIKRTKLEMLMMIVNKNRYKSGHLIMMQIHRLQAFDNMIIIRKYTRI